MEKEVILHEIQNMAGIMVANGSCRPCKAYIWIFDILALFPHCKNTQADVREILCDHNMDNCTQRSLSIQEQCQSRKVLMEKYLIFCEENPKTIDN